MSASVTLGGVFSAPTSLVSKRPDRRTGRGRVTQERLHIVNLRRFRYGLSLQVWPTEDTAPLGSHSVEQAQLGDVEREAGVRKVGVGHVVTVGARDLRVDRDVSP